MVRILTAGNVHMAIRLAKGSITNTQASLPSRAANTRSERSKESTTCIPKYTAGNCHVRICSHSKSVEDRHVSELRSALVTVVVDVLVVEAAFVVVLDGAVLLVVPLLVVLVLLVDERVDVVGVAVGVV